MYMVLWLIVKDMMNLYIIIVAAGLKSVLWYTKLGHLDLIIRCPNGDYETTMKMTSGGDSTGGGIGGRGDADLDGNVDGDGNNKSDDEDDDAAGVSDDGNGNDDDDGPDKGSVSGSGSDQSVNSSYGGQRKTSQAKPKEKSKKRPMFFEEDNEFKDLMDTVEVKLKLRQTNTSSGSNSDSDSDT